MAKRKRKLTAAEKGKKEASAERVHDYFRKGEAEASQATTDYRRYGCGRVYSKERRSYLVASK